MSVSYEITRQYYRNQESFKQTAQNETTSGIVTLPMSLREFHDACVNHKRNQGLKFKPFEFRGTSSILTIEEWIKDDAMAEYSNGLKQYYSDQTRNNRADRFGG